MINLPNFSENKQIQVYSILAIVMSLLLYLGIFSTYAFTDANEFLYSAHTSSQFIDVFVQGGRPIYGELNKLIFGNLIDTVSQLKWIRLISLLGCVLFSIQLFRFLIKSKFHFFESAFFSLLVLSLPSFGVFMSWSVTYEIPIALNCSFWAGVLLLKSIENKRLKVLNYSVALLLVVISLSLYQSAGTAFLIPFVILFTKNSILPFSILIKLGVFFIVSFGLYYVTFKLSLALYDLAPLGRSGIDILNLPQKVLNFYTLEMETLLYGSSILIKSYLLLSLASFCFLGYFFFLIKDKTKSIFIVFLVLVIPFSYLPNLLSVDSWICSRTLAPAAVIVLFYQFYFLRQLSIKSKIAKGISVGFFVFLLLFSSYNLNVYFTGIQSKEYSALHEEFGSYSFSENETIILIRPEHNFLQATGYYKYSYSDEFGQLSCSRDWVPIPFLKQVIKETNPTASLPIIKTYGPQEPYNLSDSSALIIDLSKILIKHFEN